MRLTYLDEGGTARHEPYFVVGTVIVESDTQLVAVESYSVAGIGHHPSVGGRTSIPKRWKSAVLNVSNRAIP